MAGPNLPTNLVATNASGQTVVNHEAHHDATHNIINDFDVDNAPNSGFVPIGNGLQFVARGLVSSDVPTLAVNTRTASYTLTATDAGKVVELNVATANTLTVPSDSSVAFPVGTQIAVRQTGVGATTVQGAGVSLVSVAGGATVTLAGQWAEVVVTKAGANLWVVSGGVTGSGGGGSGTLGVALPLTTGVAAAGSATAGSHEDHVHPATMVHNTRTSSYTLVLSDLGKMVEMNVATANTVTIPPNIFPVGTQVGIRQSGPGATSIQAGAGVTLQSPTGAAITLTTRWAEAVATQSAMNVWVVSGGVPEKPVRQTKTASYTLVASDVRTEIEMNVASANMVTVSTAFLSAAASDDEVLVRQYGAGVTTIVAGAGTTPLSSDGAMSIAGRYGRAVITVRSATEFYVDGYVS